MQTIFGDSGLWNICKGEGQQDWAQEMLSCNEIATEASTKPRGYWSQVGPTEPLQGSSTFVPASTSHWSLQGGLLRYPQEVM